MMGRWLLLGMCLLLGLPSLAQSFTRQEVVRFHNAAVIGDLDLVRSFLQRGMPVDKRRGTFESTPLMAAAKFGQLETVKFLLSKGADPKAQDALDRTALFYAKREEHTAVVKLLESVE